MKSRIEMAHEEATRSPIFLFQRRMRGNFYETEMVFYSRDEAEQYGRDYGYNYRKGWRVYSVPASGFLVDVLNMAHTLEAQGA